MGPLSKSLVVFLFVAAGCTGGSGDGAGRPDANPFSPDAGTETLQLTCNADQSSLPAFSRSCQSAADCAVAIHQINCCGSTIATGVSESDLNAFEDAESQCAPLFPGCDCAAFPPVLDDGSTATDIAAIEVGCTEQGICQTFGVQPGA